MSFFRSKLPVFKPTRSVQKLSHFRLTTLKMGKLVPICSIEVAPGDQFRLGVSALARLQPMYAPVMANLDAKFYWFYSPYRLLWNHSDDFFTGGSNGKAVEKPLWPKLTPFEFVSAASNYRKSALGYLRYPNLKRPFSDMDMRMMFSIWNEYFRNENIQDEVVFDKDAQGPNSSILDACINAIDNLGYMDTDLLFNRNWKKDYFTASQPWTQKGDEVFIPLDVTAEDFTLLINQGSPQNFGQRKFLSSVYPPGSSVGSIIQTPTATGTVDGTTVVSTPDANNTPLRFTIVDPTTLRPYEFASGLSVNVLRDSISLQRMLERKLRYGSRLVEYLLGVHGVKLSDKTAQRVRYIGGCNIPIQIGELLQTSATQEQQPLGQMSGTGYMRGSGSGGSYFCEEYGLIQCYCVVQPPAMYMNTTPKHLLKDDPYDFLLPQFCHLGDQEIYNIEINANHVDPDGVFGYIGRYDEYRTHPDIVDGDFADSLMDWHMARELPNNVALNNDFIRSQPTTRIFNVQSTSASDVLLQGYLHILAKRNLTKYAIPR